MINTAPIRRAHSRCSHSQKKNCLVVGQSEIAVKFFKLGYLPVFFKALQPFVMAQRGQRAHQGFPFRNG